jgi:hypothetical protein
MAGGTGAGGEDEDDDGGVASCVRPGISAARRDIERPPGKVIAPLEGFAAADGVVAPAKAVEPDSELRGAIVLGVAVVIVVEAAVLESARGAVAGADAAPILVETEVSLV